MLKAGSSNLPKQRVLSTLTRLHRESKEPLSRGLELRANQPSYRKYGIISLIAALRTPGMDQIMPYLSMGGRPPSVGAHIGSGTDQVVFTDPESTDTVIKVGIGRLTRSREKAESLAVEEQKKVDLVSKYMGAYCLSTEFGAVELNIFGKQMWTVASKQPFIKDGEPVFIDDVLDREVLGKVNPADQITDFCDRANLLRDEQGLYVDPLGEGNLLVNNGRLLLVDTVPISPESAAKPSRIDGMTMGDDIDSRLEAMSRFMLS